MRKLTKSLVLLIVMVLCCTSAMACDDKTPIIPTPENVAVASVSLSQTTLSMMPEKTATLTATVLPENATNKKVAYSSSNENIVSVTDIGELTALSTGSSTITVTTEDGKKTATCEVIVTSAAETLASIELVAPTKTEYMIGQQISLDGGKIIAKFADDSTIDVLLTSIDVAITGFDSSVAGTKTVTVTYKGLAKTFDVVIKSLSIQFVAPTKTEYYVGAKIPDLTGGKFVITENGIATDVMLTDAKVKITSFDTATAGASKLQFSYNDEGSYELAINVVDKFFTAGSLKDADYVSSMKQNNNAYEITEKGLKITGKDATSVTIAVRTDKTDVYGMRVKVSSEFDGVTFGLTFNEQSQMQYISSWQGNNIPVPTNILHRSDGDSSKAVKGSYDSVARLKHIASDGNGEIYAPNFGWLSNDACDLISAGSVMTLKLAIFTPSETDVSITFEDLSFLNEAEYKEITAPKGQVIFTAPTNKIIYQGALKPDLSTGNITVKEQGKDDVVLALTNPAISIKTFDSSAVTNETPVVLTYAEVDYTYNVKIIENTFSFANMKNPVYQSGLFNNLTAASWKVEGDGLVLTSNNEWGGFEFVTYLPTDVMSLKINIEAAEGALLTVAMLWGDMSIQNQLQTKGVYIDASGKLDRIIKFNEFIDTTAGWAPNPTKAAALLEAVQFGEKIKLSFTIDGPDFEPTNPVNNIKITDVAMLNQVEYDAATNVTGAISLTTQPTNVNVFRGAISPDLTGGVLSVTGSVPETINLPNANVSITDYAPNTLGAQTIKLTYKNLTTTCNITVIDNTLSITNLLNANYQKQILTFANATPTYDATKMTLTHTGADGYGAAFINTYGNADIVGYHIKVNSPSGAENVWLAFNIYTTSIMSENCGYVNGESDVWKLITNHEALTLVKSGNIFKVGIVANYVKAPGSMSVLEVEFVTQAQYDAHLAA